MSLMPSHSLRACSNCDGIYARYMGLRLCAQRYGLHCMICHKVYKKPWSAPQDGIVSLQPGQGTLTPSAHTTPAKLASGPTVPAPRWRSRKITLGQPANFCGACTLRQSGDLSCVQCNLILLAACCDDMPSQRWVKAALSAKWSSAEWLSCTWSLGDHSCNNVCLQA